MSNFISHITGNTETKTKTKRKKILKTPPAKPTLLDQEYTNFEKKLQTDLKELPLLQQQLTTISTKIEDMKDRIGSLNEIELSKYHSMYDEIEYINNRIKNITDQENVMSYYINNSDILSSYYNDLQSPIHTRNSTSVTMTQTGTIEDFIDKSDGKTKISRNKLLNEYHLRNNEHYMADPEISKQDYYCSNCNVYREVFSTQSLYVCPVCADEINSKMEYDKSSYKDIQQESSNFEYERLTHFNDDLDRIQGKENKFIPPEVYAVIEYEFTKNKYTDWNSLTPEMGTSFLCLKKYAPLKVAQYCENIHKICKKFGLQPIEFTDEMEKQLKSCFTIIDSIFEEVCPPSRQNLISYPFIRYKICQMLKYPKKYLKCSKLVKTNDRLFEQDRIWYDICQKTGWTFLPSSRDVDTIGVF